MKSESRAKGNLLVFSAPSGGGKTTLVAALTRSTPGIIVSVSHTTRAKRPAETHGINYYFVDEPTFCQMVEAGQFLEHAVIFGQHYGTSRQWVEDTLNQGTDVILEIDWQGCQHIQRLFPDCISVFIVPPSPTILAQRLVARGKEDPAILTERLADARETFQHLGEYDYIVLNDDLEQAVTDLRTIVLACRLQRARQQEALKPLLDRFLSDI